MSPPPPPPQLPGGNASAQLPGDRLVRLMEVAEAGAGEPAGSEAWVRPARKPLTLLYWATTTQRQRLGCAYRNGCSVRFRDAKRETEEGGRTAELSGAQGTTKIR